MICRCPNEVVHAQREADRQTETRRYAEQAAKKKVAKLEKEIANLTPDPPLS